MIIEGRTHFQVANGAINEEVVRKGNEAVLRSGWAVFFSLAENMLFLCQGLSPVKHQNQKDASSEHHSSSFVYFYYKFIER